MTLAPEVVGTNDKVKSLSFLVRLWRAPRPDADEQGSWIGEVRHVVTGETIRFRGLADLTGAILKLLKEAK